MSNDYTLTLYTNPTTFTTLTLTVYRPSLTTFVKNFYVSK